jgi:hypothetical protein
MAAPLFILAPHRSFTSVVCSMLGQHPQAYGLPEMNLFISESLLEWWMKFRGGTELGAHGPLRVVAELYFGGQTEYTIKLAHQWLRRRLRRTTGSILREIAQKLYPLVLIDKSPTTVYRVEFMERARQNFPRARFLHLLRHPRGHGESIVKALSEFGKFGALPRGARELRSKPPPKGSWPRRGIGAGGVWDFSVDPPTIDPQYRWYRLHSNIAMFFDFLPEEQKLRIRGEDLLTNPDPYLHRIASWLELRTDGEAIEEMKHPERSPFARFGPRNAHLGNDPNFLQQPTLRPSQVNMQSLDGPVSWRKDGAGFAPQVRELAQRFGYR